MGILAGYLTACPVRPPSPATMSSGPIAVRRKIGYMPESCPLYHDAR
jgi:hypothetical protein